MDGSIRQIISSLGANATESARSFLDARRLTDSIDLIREAKNNGQITPGLQLVEAECFLEIRKYHEALKCVSEEESAFAISQESSALRAKIETIRERNEHVNRPEHTELVSRIMNSLTAPSVKVRVLDIVSRMEQDPWHDRSMQRYQSALQGGTPWFDTPSFLNWYSTCFKPRTFIEVGVRRGRSFFQVLCSNPQVFAVGVDMWIPDYGTIPEQGIQTHNVGPELIKLEANKFGIPSTPQLLSGSSRDILPVLFLDKNCPQEFDLWNVDGDHSYDGARADLEVAFKHLAPGGALVFDDVSHMTHPELARLWEEYHDRFPDHIFLQDETGTGTAVILKPPFDKYAIL